jgi:hypothetical protein
VQSNEVADIASDRPNVSVAFIRPPLFREVPNSQGLPCLVCFSVNSAAHRRAALVLGQNKGSDDGSGVRTAHPEIGGDDQGGRKTQRWSKPLCQRFEERRQAVGVPVSLRGQYTRNRIRIGTYRDFGHGAQVGSPRAPADCRRRQSQRGEGREEGRSQEARGRHVRRMRGPLHRGQEIGMEVRQTSGAMGIDTR